jgi:acyl-CoA synthetase (NDP forming)
MMHSNLINPSSIAIIGGSPNTAKPGGKIIENLLRGSYKGALFVVNPKSEYIHNLPTYPSIEAAPTPDLAILAIPARFCPQSIEELCEKGTRAFIILSAGFGELDEEGKLLDQQILALLQRYDASLMGPNCIGIIHEKHHSVFTTPVPKIVPNGVEFISSSGSTAVFIVEAGMIIGVPFSNIFTVGNALQIKVEDILEYLDESFDPERSSRVKMIYIENIDDPQKFIRHSRSLIQKGAHIVALKAGMTEAGNRAASSHTGAMASPSVAVEAMFRKAGVIQCYSRQELLYTAAILLKGKVNGRNVAVITHAGGAGVLLTDALEKNGLKVPEINGDKATELLDHLFPGSSIRNPIDFLATGTQEQLELIIDYCEKDFDHIAAIAVIFGSPGLFDVQPVYEMLARKMVNGQKPIYPILPSPVNNEEALKKFVADGQFYFPEETRFGEALARVLNHDVYGEDAEKELSLDLAGIREVIDQASEGYLSPKEQMTLLRAAGIPVIPEFYASDQDSLRSALAQIPFPVVMKAIGPVHKSDVGGVQLNIKNVTEAEEHGERIMRLPGVNSVLVQPMIAGKEIFIGAKKEDKFGHLILFGMGGIFLEIFGDVQALLTPLNPEEVSRAMQQLKSYPILEGIRGQKGIDIGLFSDIILRVSKLLDAAPEIQEMDLNPLMAVEDKITVVDARIRI